MENAVFIQFSIICALCFAILAAELVGINLQSTNLFGVILGFYGDNEKEIGN